MKIRIGLMICAIVAVMTVSMTACRGRSSAVAPAPAAGNEPPVPEDGRFVGRMWISSTAGAPRGSFVIFLPDHTMLMGSCVETYRLSEWGVAGERIRWREDTIPIEAEVTMPRNNQMALRIPGKEREQTYVLASAPYVCPDLPR